MKLILGLGNPGLKYEHTRHNAGFDALDKLAAFFQVNLKKRCFFPYMSAKIPGAMLIKPLTYMNNSGKVLKTLGKHCEACDVAVICDNMDLAVGGLRIKFGGGSSGQKGVNSIAQYLKSDDFVRIYVGTGRPEEGVAVNDHVLSKETNPEKLKAYNQSLELASQAACDFINGVPIGQIQCKYNRKGIL